MKKTGLLFVALLALVFTSSAFSGGAKESAAAKKVKIVHWAFQFVDEASDQKMYQSFLPDLQKTAPNVEVEVEFFPWDGRRDRMLTAIAGKTAPDVVYLNDDMKPLFYPNLLDLTPYLSADELKDFKPGSIQSAKYKNELCYLPVLINSVAHFVNLDLLAKLGYPADWTEKQHTWDEFLELCDKARKAGLTAYTMGPANASIVDELSNWIYQAGAAYYNADTTKCTLNSPEAVRAFTFLAKLWEEKYVNPADMDKTSAEVSEGVFAQGKCVAIMAQNQAITNWKKVNPSLRVGLAYALKDKADASNGTVAGFGSFKQSKNPEAAVAWIKVLTGPNAMSVIDQQLSFIPPRFSVDAAMKAKMNDPIFNRAVENSQWFQPTVPASPVGAAANEEIKVAFQKIILKKQPVDQALEELTTKVNKLLDDYYKKAK